MKSFILLWLYAVTLIALAAASLHSTFEENRLLSEAQLRASSLATSIEDSVSANYLSGRINRIGRTVERLRSQQRLQGLIFCPTENRAPVGFPKGPESNAWESICRSPLLSRSLDDERDVHWRSRSLQYTAHHIEDGSALIVIQDLTYLKERWLATFLKETIFAWCSGTALLLLVTAQLRRWLEGNLRLLQQFFRSLMAGRRPTLSPPDLKPITEDMDKLAAKVLSLSKAQPAKQEPTWVTSLRKSMEGRRLTVIANREPYIHERDTRGHPKVVRPASGLVTALEPILRQCGGLWIAHGGGSADRETADRMGEVKVPPDRPTYTLRRVWLTRQEENGYYYGFANEGLWPLCHLAHTRPTFRLSDWNHYRAVNERFAASVPESSLASDSLILVQDYHFALLPRALMDRRAAGGAKIGLFWHIPWPNPEAFGICPWNRELLRGMLGADLIGFHTQYHCNNFLESCNRYLEARVDMENFSVTMENHQTMIRAFPIGIDTTPVRTLSDAEREELKTHYGVRARFVAVGVDRLDYTKGLIERVEAVERFLEKNPQYIGEFSLVQMGSPSRTNIPSYRALVSQLTECVARVNDRFASRANPSGYKPIVFLPRHHEWEEIRYFYQLGDVCLVTSLHDGMNLVAKEYVWCQRPDRGSLILSRFTGASRELTDAFLVNPYAIEEMADALAASLALTPDERERRMLAMREKVQAHNAYHWASDIIEALVRKEEASSLPPAAESQAPFAATS